MVHCGSCQGINLYYFKITVILFYDECFKHLSWSSDSTVLNPSMRMKQHYFSNLFICKGEWHLNLFSLQQAPNEKMLY